MTQSRTRRLWVGLIALPSLLSACQAGEAVAERSREFGSAAVAPVGASTKDSDALPLRVPIRGVMAGIVDFSAHGVFKTATTEDELSESDWIAAGYAAINLISASTLITTPGTGPQDKSWVDDPSWRLFATDLQAASIEAGIAISRRDREKFLAAADEIADACASCHSRFRDKASPPAGTRFAGRQLP